MRRASLPLRLDRLGERRASADLERAVRDLAAEYELDPAEVRAELEAITARIRRFGPCDAEEFVRRCAAEFGLPEEELRAELARAASAVGLPAETAR